MSTLTVVSKQKLESLHREQKPTRMTLIAIPKHAAAGPTGTGKTLAAEVLAGLSRPHQSVAPGYIGETEKNLSRLLDEAERGGVVLLFDEADALFGKRNGVKDAHDRYANQETGLLRPEDAKRSIIAILVGVSATARRSPLASHFRWIDLP